jgi:hypothetical protein
LAFGYAQLYWKAAGETLSLESGGRQIDISLKTGDVKLSAGLTPSDASVIFWKTMSRAIPEIRKQLFEIEVGMTEEALHKIIADHALCVARQVRGN